MIPIPVVVDGEIVPENISALIAFSFSMMIPIFFSEWVMLERSKLESYSHIQEVCEFYADQSEKCNYLQNPETCQSAFKIGLEACSKIGLLEEKEKEFFRGEKAKCDRYREEAGKACLVDRVSCQEIPSHVTNSCLEIVTKGYDACIRRYEK